MPKTPYPARRLLCRCISSVMPANDGPIIVGGMLRNERDIVEIWTSHLKGFADRVILFDHLSTDGTREFLLELAERDPRFDVRLYDVPRLDQSELMTAIHLEVSAAVTRGWLFFLDADEFLVGRDRHDLLARLSKHRAAANLTMHIQHAMPADTSPHPITAQDQVLTWSDQRVAYGKTLINLRHGKKTTEIHMGNHTASTKAMLRKIPSELELIHLPARSTAQINRKIQIGTAANALRENGERTATHWQAWSRREQRDEDVQRISYVYGHGETENAPDPDWNRGTLGTLVPLGD